MNIPDLHTLLDSTVVCRARNSFADEVRLIPPASLPYLADEVDVGILRQCTGENIIPALLHREENAHAGLMRVNLKARIDMKNMDVLPFYEDDNMQDTLYADVPLNSEHAMRCLHKLPMEEQCGLLQVAFARRHRTLLSLIRKRDACDRPTGALEKRIASLEVGYATIIDRVCDYYSRKRA